jgi:hypothetical protein
VTYAAIVNASTTLLHSYVPALNKVVDARAYQQGNLAAADCPGIVFASHTTQETAWTHTNQQRVWWLDASLWAYYPNISTSIGNFDQFEEDVCRTFREHPTLDDAAETDGCHIISIGRQQLVGMANWLDSGIGQIIRTVTISLRVVEELGL